MNAEAIVRAEALLGDLAKRGIEVTPFRRRSDVTLRVFDLVDQIQSGECLKLYVRGGLAPAWLVISLGFHQRRTKTEKSDAVSCAGGWGR